MRLRHWLGTKEEMRRAPEGGMQFCMFQSDSMPLRDLCPETGCRRADGVCPLWPSAGIVLIDLLTLTLTRPTTIYRSLEEGQARETWAPERQLDTSLDIHGRGSQ